MAGSFPCSSGFVGGVVDEEATDAFKVRPGLGECRVRASAMCGAGLRLAAERGAADEIAEHGHGYRGGQLHGPVLVADREGCVTASVGRPPARDDLRLRRSSSALRRARMACWIKRLALRRNLIMVLSFVRSDETTSGPEGHAHRRAAGQDPPPRTAAV